MFSNVRLATHDDLPAVEAVVRRAYSPYVRRIGRPPGPKSDDYKALIELGHVHVVERAGCVQAILVLIPRNDVMLLDNVAVSPFAQGADLGRKLLEHAERVAREQGRQSIRLYTNEAMTENINLYERVGYTETHRAEENGLRRVYMINALR